jgi:hypothetical protein
MSESGEPYTVTLTIRRTLVVDVPKADSVEAAVAAAVLMINSWNFPECHYPTSPDEGTGKCFVLTHADAYQTPRKKEAPQDDR